MDGAEGERYLTCDGLPPDFLFYDGCLDYNVSDDKIIGQKKPHSIWSVFFCAPLSGLRFPERQRFDSMLCNEAFW